MCKDIDECTSSPCDHNYTNTDGGFECCCIYGYRAVHICYINTFLLSDIDECDNSFPCDQMCTNTLGSFQCSCNSGYTMDGTRCNGQ